MAAKVSRDQYVWRGADRTRSFAEFRLLRDLLKQDLPVPRPIAAYYLREGPFYRASILMERLLDVRSLADLAAVDGHSEPWEETGRLVAGVNCVGSGPVPLHPPHTPF